MRTNQETALFFNLIGRKVSAVKFKSWSICMPLRLGGSALAQSANYCYAKTVLPDNKFISSKG